MSEQYKRKLSPSDAIDLRELYASGDFTTKVLAEMYSVSTACVYRIIKGFSYKSITGGTEVTLPNRRKRASGNTGHRGATHPNSKLTDEKVMEIRRIWATQLSQAEIADKFGISVHTAVNIIHQHSWRHLPSVDDIRKEMQNET